MIRSLSCGHVTVRKWDLLKFIDFIPISHWTYLIMNPMGVGGGCFPLLPSFKLRIGNGCRDQFLQKFKRAEESLKIIPYFNFLDDIFKVVKTIQK